ncbi:MAG: TadE family protein [Bryobacteraceae bacterium]|nr:TadE family protein [Bryobacteraceae bacterium]
MTVEKRGRRRRGNASIELALTATFMITAMFGIIDFGRMFGVASAVSSAARAGTMYGSQDVARSSDFNGMQTAAKNDGQNVQGMTATATQFCTCSLGGAQQSCSVTCSSGVKRTYVKVVVGQTFSTAFQYPLVPQSTNLSSTSIVRIQ